MAAFVYILRCADVGSMRTTLEERIVQHNAANFDGYTARRRPVTLAFCQEFDRITDAEPEA
jgi:putative endonuclease